MSGLEQKNARGGKGKECQLKQRPGCRRFQIPKIRRLREFLVRSFPAYYRNEQTLSHAIHRPAPDNLVEKKPANPNQETDRVAQWDEDQFSCYPCIAEPPRGCRPNQAETENQ